MLGWGSLWLPDPVGTSQGVLRELCAAKDSIHLCHCWAEGWGKALLHSRLVRGLKIAAQNLSLWLGAVVYQSAAVKACFYLFSPSVRWKTRVSCVRKFHQQFLLLVDGPAVFPEQSQLQPGPSPTAPSACHQAGVNSPGSPSLTHTSTALLHSRPWREALCGAGLCSVQLGGWHQRSHSSQGLTCCSSHRKGKWIASLD